MGHLQKLFYLYYTHYSCYEIQIRNRKDYYYYFWIYIVIVIAMEPTTDKLMLVFNN